MFQAFLGDSPVKSHMRRLVSLSLCVAVGLALTCLVGLPVAAQSATPVMILTDMQGQYPLGLALETLEDPSGQLTLAQVMAPPYAAQFVPNPQAVPNFGFTNSTYWVRFQVRNEAQLVTDWRLEVGLPTMNMAELYAPSPNGYILTRLGYFIPFADREVAHPNPTFRLTLPPHQSHTVYLRFQTAAAMLLPLTLWSPAAFAEKYATEQLVTGLVYGAVFIVLAFNLVLAFFLRDRSYLYLTAAMAARLLLFAVVQDGRANQYLWPQQAEWNRVLPALSVCLLGVATLQFTRAFLETAQRTPRLERLLQALQLGCVGLAGVVFFVPHAWSIRLAFGAYVLVLPCVLTGAFVVWRQGYLPARFFLLANLVVYAQTLSEVFTRFGVLINLQSLNSPVGLVLWVFLWSLAQADRINVLRLAIELANQRLQASETRYVQLNAQLEQRVAERSRDLAASELKHRTLVEQLPVVVYRDALDERAANYYVSPQAAVLFGYPPAAWVEDPYLWNKLIHPEDQARALATIDETLQRGASVAEYRLVAQDGRIVWVRDDSMVVRDANGQPQFMQGILQDITAIKQAEAQLRRSEEVLRLLVENSPAAIAMFDREMHYLVVSRQYQLDYDLGEQKLIGRSVYAVFPAVSARWRIIHQRCLAGAVEGAAAESFPRANGRIDWVRWELHPWRESDGRIGGLILFSELITEQIQAAEALRQQNEYLTALQETTLGLLQRLELLPLLEAIVTRAAALMGTAHGQISLLALDDTVMQVQVGIGVEYQFVGDQTARGEGLVGRVWQTGRPLAVEDYRLWAGRKPGANYDLFRASVGVPLFSAAQVVGVLNLDYDAPRNFDAQEIALLQRFAQLAAVALDNAQLFEATRHQTLVLRETQLKYQTLAEQMPAVTYIDTPDATGTATYISPQIEAWLGYTIAEWENDPLLWHKLVHPDDYAHALNIIKATLTAGRGTAEYRMVARTGQVVWLRDESVLIRDAQGQPRWVQGLLLDITARKQADEALRDSEARFNSVIASAHDAILMVDAEQHIVLFNPAAERLFHCTAAEAVGQSLTRFIPERHRAPHLAYLQQYGQMGHTARRMGRLPNLTALRATGEEFPAEISISCVQLRGTAFYTAFVRDLTELQQADKLREDLVRTMVHDLRNPLSVIQEVLTAVEGTTAAQTRMLALAQTATGQLLGLVNTILDVSRLESGQLVLTPEVLVLPDLVNESLGLEMPLANKKGLTLTSSYASALPPIRADVALLRRVLQNLIGNAVKFAPPNGQVQLNVQTQANQVMVAVFNTGAGIPLDMQGRLFQKFVTGMQKERGTGLGLAFCKLAIEAHGGRIWAESQPSQGATFYFTLPH